MLDIVCRVIAAPTPRLSCKHLDAITSGLPGSVERVVGGPDQLIDALAVARVLGNADRQRDVGQPLAMIDVLPLLDVVADGGEPGRARIPRRRIGMALPVLN